MKHQNETEKINDSVIFDSKLLLSLQRWLLDLVNIDRSERITKIANSIFILDSNNISIFIEELLIVLSIRPQNINIFVDITAELTKQFPESKSIFSDILLKNLMYKSDCFHSKLYFYRGCIEKNILDINQLVDSIHQFYKDVGDMSVILFLFVFFLKEIHDLKPKFFKELLDRFNTECDENLKLFNNFFVNVESYVLNDFAKWKFCIEHMCDYNSLTYLLAIDDIDAFQEKAVDDFNFIIEPSIFERASILTKNTSLLQYCAFFGSVNCFKFILLQGASIKYTDTVLNTVYQYAVAGGNIEIISLLEQNDVSFCISQYENAVIYSIKFARNEIYQWLESIRGTEIEDNKKPDPLQAAVISDNIICISNLLNKGFNIAVILEKGWSLLHYAAFFGRSISVRALIVNPEIDVNHGDQRGWTALHWACYNFYPNSVRALLENENIDVNAMNLEGTAPIHWAVSTGNLEVVELLVSHPRINVNIRNCDLQTSLHIASDMGYHRIVEILLKCKDIDVNAKDSRQVTPLYLAAEKGHYKVIEVLATCPQVDINDPDEYNWTPLHAFANSDISSDLQMKTIKALFEFKNIVVNIKDRKGNSPLDILAESCFNKDLLKFFISHPDVRVTDVDEFGQTPLHHAASSCNVTAIEVLLDSPGIEPNSVDNMGQTALFWALNQDNVFEDQRKAVEMLVQVTNMKIKNQNDETVLHIAMRSRSPYILNMILNQSYIDFNSRTKNGETPLHYAVKFNNEVAVEKLLEKHEILVLATDNKQENALHMASRSASREMLQLLLSSTNINPNSVNKSLQTPLQVAVESEKFENVCYLYKYKGVDPHIADINGRSPRVNALRFNFTKIAEVLSQ